MVDIPNDLECNNCTIRLIRQALEWSERYLFWSCADVDIVQPGKYREDCFGHGKPNAGRCRCDRLYYGETFENQNLPDWSICHKIQSHFGLQIAQISYFQPQSLFLYDYQSLC
jgi:hypothetical protein